MKIINKAWTCLYKSGLFLFTWFILFISAVLLVSISQKNTIHYGERCNTSLKEDAINYIIKEDIIAYDYTYHCNTLYLDLSVNDSMTIPQITAMLIRISTHYKNSDILNQTHATVKNSHYLVLASLLSDGSVSFTTTLL